jgi:hypothetical protein
MVNICVVRFSLARQVEDVLHECFVLFEKDLFDLVFGGWELNGLQEVHFLLQDGSYRPVFVFVHSPIDL